MKEKLPIYGLIVLASLVWALVAYRIFKSMNKTNETSSTSSFETPLKSNILIDDSYSLYLNYPSPFSEKVILEKKPIESTNQVYETEPIINHEDYYEESPDSAFFDNQSLWPEIDYLGFSDKKYHNNETILLTIDGSPEMMEKYETLDGLQLMSITPDSIQLKYNGEYQTYYNN